MSRPSRILLQTTIPFTADDWHIGRFSALAAHLAGLRDAGGAPLYDVLARNRDAIGAPDSILSTLDASDFTQIWLFAVDVGNGLDPRDCAAIARFRRRGGGVLVTRDHMDLGSSVCALAGVGAAHHFHSTNPEPEPERRRNDDPYTTDISWPNYHSGANGDYQFLTVVDPPHPTLRDPESPNGRLRYLPAHPHEGAVGKPPDDPTARVIATGRSAVTGTIYNIAVAFEPSPAGGPAIAQSTFHHFTDYNWDPRARSPSFVAEAPGDGMIRSKEAARSVRRYVSNLALWLACPAAARAKAEENHREWALDEALEESFPASDSPAV